MIENIAADINHNKRKITMLDTHVYSVQGILTVKFLPYRKRTVSPLQRTIG
jgi:hypothetical protein